MAVMYVSELQRRDTPANWTSEDPVLLAGQIGVELVSPAVTQFKIGDGVTAWSGLPYSNGGSPAAPTVIGTRTVPEPVSEPIDAPTTDDTLLFAEGNGGPVTIDNIGAPPSVGARLTINVPVAASNTITLSNGGNIEINGGSILMGAGSVISLMYDGLNYIEVSRNGL